MNNQVKVGLIMRAVMKFQRKNLMMLVLSGWRSFQVILE